MPVTPEQAQLAFSGASALLAAVLAGVTYLYYRETKAHTKEMQKTREQNMRPVIKPTIDSYGGMIQRLEIINTGPGAAHDVTVTWGFNHLDYEEFWTVPLQTSGQEHIFELPFDEDSPSLYTLDELEERLGEDCILEFRAEYTDAFGRPYNTVEEIDVLETVSSRAHKEDANRPELSKIHQELKKMRKDFRKVRKSLEKNPPRL